MRTLRERSSWSPSAQNATHLSLGCDTSTKTTVVRSDFTAKPTPRVRLEPQIKDTVHYTIIISHSTLQFKQVIPDGVHDIHLAVSQIQL